MEALPPQLQSVLKQTRVKQVPKGQILLYQGDRAATVFVIKSGVIKIYDIDEQGNEKILHLAKRPAVLPFAFFSGTPRPVQWFYSTLVDCELYEVPYDAFLQYLRTDNAMAIYLMNWFSKEMHAVLLRLSSLGKSNVRDKLVAALQMLQAGHSTKRRGDWWRVDFPVQHQLLADIIGITRESVALAMKTLQDEKVIRYQSQGTLEINRTKLSADATTSAVTSSAQS